MSPQEPPEHTAFSYARLLGDHARDRPEAPAVVCGAHRLTYAELHARSVRVGGALASSGVSRGGRVAVLSRNRPEFFELLGGASLAGAVLLALNWRLARPELSAILDDGEPSLLIVEPELAELVADSAAARDVPVVVLGDEYDHWRDAAASSDRDGATGSDDVILQLYSSGTTGLPKGIMLTNENMAYSATMARRGFRMSEASVNMVVSPLFHIGGIGYGTMALTQGGCTVIMREAGAAAILETIEREAVTHTFLVPAVIKSLLDESSALARDVWSLELVSYGGAPMSESLLRRGMSTLGCGFLGVYGMTETAGTVVALEPEDHDPEGERSHLLRSVGRPLPWLDVAVMDLATGREAAAGVVGEIRVRSGQNMKGYWRQEAATAEALGADGWLCTGDAAHRDDEGYLFLHDRIKDMIISGGENVYPAEVENVLADHPAVAEVAVIGVPSERWGETVKAAVVVRRGQGVDASALREFTRARLAHYKCPPRSSSWRSCPATPRARSSRPRCANAVQGMLARAARHPARRRPDAPSPRTDAHW